MNAPWQTRDFRVTLLAMNDKTRLVEVEFPAYAVAVATIAFTLMVGTAIWKSLAGRYPWQTGSGMCPMRRSCSFQNKKARTIFSFRLSSSNVNAQFSTGYFAIMGNRACSDCAKPGASAWFAGRMNFVRPVPDASLTFRASRSKRA